MVTQEVLFLKQSAGHCAPMKTIVNAPAKNTMVKDAAKETVKDATANPTMVKDAAANPLEAILQQMQKQNALLIQRLDNLETQNKQLQEIGPEPEPVAPNPNPHEALLQQMQKQNAFLMQRLDNLETQNKELRAQKSPPRSRSCSSPRTPTTRKQPKKKTIR